MSNPNPKTENLTPFQPSSDKGPLDKRKLTVRLYTPERDRVEQLVKQHGLKEGEISRALMEYALQYADDINFGGEK